MENNQNNHQNIFTYKQIDSFAGFFGGLRRIHDRLIAEGYTIKDGKICKPELNNS